MRGSCRVAVREGTYVPTRSGNTECECILEILEYMHVYEYVPITRRVSTADWLKHIDC